MGDHPNGLAKFYYSIWNQKKKEELILYKLFRITLWLVSNCFVALSIKKIKKIVYARSEYWVSWIHKILRKRFRIEVWSGNILIKIQWKKGRYAPFWKRRTDSGVKQYSHDMKMEKNILFQFLSSFFIPRKNNKNRFLFKNWAHKI